MIRDILVTYTYDIDLIKKPKKKCNQRFCRDGVYITMTDCTVTVATDILDKIQLVTYVTSNPEIVFEKLTQAHNDYTLISGGKIK